MVNAVEIEYLEPKNEFKVGSVKNIAVPSNNKDDIKKMYPGSKKTQSNADMLSQSFGTTPQINANISQTQPVQNVTEPVQISPIPTMQNSNLESEPVSLDMNTVSVPEIPVVEPVNVIPEIPKMEQTINLTPEIQTPDSIVNNMPNLTTDNVSIPTIDSPQQQVVEQTSPEMENPFKVSDAPNIFDIPAPIAPVQETPNVFAQTPESIVETGVNNNQKVSDYSADIEDDIINAEIAILESDIKHYEGLVENNRKKIELLRKQIKKEENEVNLENTASNLFSNNGILDEDKVLGKTPMPNLRAA